MAKKKPLKPRFRTMAPIALAELGYTFGEEDDPFEDDFQDCAMYTLLHTKSLQDAATVLALYNYVAYRWRSLTDICANDRNYWKKCRQERTGIQLVTDEEARNVCYMTNLLLWSDEWDGETYCIEPLVPVPGIMSGASVDCNAFYHNRQPNCITSDSSYALEFDPAKLRLGVMNLYRNGERICDLRYNSEDCSMTVMGDDFPYILKHTGKDVEIYRKDYILSLAPDEAPDPARMAAHMQWCVVDEARMATLARLEFLADDVDRDLIKILADAYMTKYWTATPWPKIIPSPPEFPVAAAGEYAYAFEPDSTD
ncbi:MAG: hypothetical protein LUD50_01545 [Clostridia bacterium]|nr:hypothetical protein [Clostridia bacterium]